MKAHYVLLVLLSPVSLLAQAPSGQKPDFSALRHEVQLKIANGDVPGLAVGVASGGGDLWAEGVCLGGAEELIHANGDTAFFYSPLIQFINSHGLILLIE